MHLPPFLEDILQKESEIIEILTESLKNIIMVVAIITHNYFILLLVIIDTLT